MDIEANTDHAAAASVIPQPYFLPNPSPWPLMGAVGGFMTVFGIVLAAHYGNYVLLVLGVLTVLTTMAMWWRDVLREGRPEAAHSALVRLGLRYGMTLFIASEVMFFVGFFWAYFNFLLFPTLQGNGQTVWPPADIHTYDPFHLPLLNTMLLLLSGTTVTWAHHSLLENNRKGLLQGLGLTIILGMCFTCCQIIEYSHAPFKFVGGGVYASTFFLATGFHGFHVIVGTCFLIVCWFRAKNGELTPERHFGFEAAAWYWHFVDVVWLFLFTCIYWYGAGQIAPG